MAVSMYKPNHFFFKKGEGWGLFSANFVLDDTKPTHKTNRFYKQLYFPLKSFQNYSIDEKNLYFSYSLQPLPPAFITWKKLHRVKGPKYRCTLRPHQRSVGGVGRGKVVHALIFLLSTTPICPTSPKPSLCLLVANIIYM